MTPRGAHPGRLAAAVRLFAGLALTLVILTVAAGLLAPALLGYDRYVIEGGSMEPSIPKGSLVFERRVPVSQLREGDVITYSPPGSSRPVTHRIHSLRQDRGGRPVLRTKGDANVRPDPVAVTLDRPVQPRVEVDVPHAGWPVIALRDRTIRLFALALPASLIALWTVLSLWRQGGDALRAEEA